MRRRTEIQLNDIENRLLIKTCFELDNELYIPMKVQFEKEGIIHPLGILKEDFKSFMCLKINEAFKEVKALIDKEAENDRAREIRKRY